MERGMPVSEQYSLKFTTFICGFSEYFFAAN